MGGCAGAEIGGGSVVGVRIARQTFANVARHRLLSRTPRKHAITTGLACFRGRANGVRSLHARRECMAPARRYDPRTRLGDMLEGKGVRNRYLIFPPKPTAPTLPIIS